MNNVSKASCMKLQKSAYIIHPFNSRSELGQAEMDLDRKDDRPIRLFERSRNISTCHREE
jgi:hypothetical protein